MKDFQLVRYYADEANGFGIFCLWCFGWLDLLRGVIRVASFGTLDTDAKIWLLVYLERRARR